MANRSELNRIVPAGLDELLRRTKQAAKSEINSITVGTIVSFDAEEQTASVRINFKRVLKAQGADGNGLPVDQEIAYPILVKCPVVVLNGGGAYVSFPIEAGDTCIVLFCDRDIDNWWAEGDTESAPNSERAHDLSDGIALVGIRSKADPIDYDANKLKIFFGGGKITIDASGNIVVAAPLLGTVSINPLIP